MKYGLKFWEHVRNVKNGRNFFKSVFIGGVIGVIDVVTSVISVIGVVTSVTSVISVIGGVTGVIGVIGGVISVEMRH